MGAAARVDLVCSDKNCGLRARSELQARVGMERNETVETCRTSGGSNARRCVEGLSYTTNPVSSGDGVLCGVARRLPGASLEFNRYPTALYHPQGAISCPA